jgi:hypothetical protein
MVSNNRRSPTRLLLVALVAVDVVILVALFASGGSRSPGSRAHRREPFPTTLHPIAQLPPLTGLFSPTSIWNAPLPADAPIDPASGALVNVLGSEVRSELAADVGPYIATNQSSTPIYVVGPAQPTVRVALDDPNISWRRSLQTAFAAVPIPAGAAAAAGPDEQMTVWQPATNKLWEFFHMRLISGAWHAAWGGAMDDVSTNPGYYGPGSWPGGRSNWGATATSFPVAAGVITLRELQSGVINHALALNIPDPRGGVVAAPAERGDGGGGPQALPEGAHLRLDPHLDLGALGLPRLTYMIARAAQRYGLIVRDRTAGISLFAEDPTQYGGESLYTGQDGVFGGHTPEQILASFPWNHLEVLSMHLVPVPRASGFLNGASTR